jgi:hypothetical protein
MEENYFWKASSCSATDFPSLSRMSKRHSCFRNSTPLNSALFDIHPPYLTPTWSHVPTQTLVMHKASHGQLVWLNLVLSLEQGKLSQRGDKNVTNISETDSKVTIKYDCGTLNQSRKT